MKFNSTTLTIIVSVFIIVAIALVIVLAPKKPLPPGSTELASFTKCLVDSGAKFYGAFWCSHCQATKALFGASAKDLPYIECSTPDMQGQTAICKEKNITQYPTWIFSDGSQKVGEVSLAELSAKTLCPLSDPTSASSTSAAVNSSSSAASSAVRQ